MRRILLAFIALVITTVAYAQSKTVTGKVTDASDKSGIPGVNVVVQGTTRGTVTDVDGAYSIELRDGETTLVFSFVGMISQTVNVGERTTMDVVLENDATQLQEVVVVGYGEQKKSDITGATANVKGEELSKQPVLTATQAMQGKVAGVQIISSGAPGTSPQIRIRGVGTAISGTTALYVVDGILTDDITNINTADIVDMTILKDASAAAIYGSRGANGVVIITTRKGKSGKLKIDYSNNIGIRQAANLVEMANATEYANYVQAATGTAPAQSPYNTDWYSTILRNAWQQTHNISLSGGSDKSSTYLNVGYLDEDGIVINHNFKRLTIRLNQDYRLHDKLKFGIQASYTNAVNKNGFNSYDINEFGNIGSLYNNAYRAAPIIASRVDGRYGNTSGYQNVGNPLLDVNNNDVKVIDSRIQAASFLEYNPLEWLTLRTSIGIDSRNGLGRVYAYQFDADEETFLIAGGNQYRSVSSLGVRHNESFRWVWDNTATIKKQFGLHDVTLLVGTTSEKYNLVNLAANRNNVPANPDLWYISVGDANTSQNEGGGDAWARNSYLARLNYGYDGRYLLTATVRTDGSSRLPKANRWQQYPSFGAAWVLSREGFMQDQNIFDFLKVRASYGKVGNDQIPTNSYRIVVAGNKPYPFAGSEGPSTVGSQFTEIIDPNITWEVTEEVDVALEFAILGSRLSGEVNYYNKEVQNALISVPINVTGGDKSGLVLTNVASIRNRGIELALNWKNQVNDDFSYAISGNVTFNKNEVTALNGGEAVLGGSIGAAQGITTRTDNGLAVGSFYVLRVLGVFNSGAEVTEYVGPTGTPVQPTAKAGDFKYWDKNNDGKIDDNDRDFAGSYQPIAYYGANVSLNFRRWDLSLAIYGNAGNEVYNGKKAVRVEGKDNVEKAMVYDRWTSANKSQTQPGANVGNLLASDYFIESGSFARINNLTIGYTFSPAFLERVKISSLRLFATSQNLFTLKEYSGFTPELPGDPTNSGIELSAYPTTRTFAAGLNVSF